MRVWICGDKEKRKQFKQAEKVLRNQGHVPVNPIKLIYALPEEINNADFVVISYEVIRICDAIYLLDDWEKDLLARLEKTYADRKEKVILTLAENR